MTRTNTRSPLVALALDVVSVFTFVAIGRRNHNEGETAGQIFEVAKPFLIALAVGWFTNRAWRQPMSRNTGISVWVMTVVLGLLLRNLVFDRGTATAFIIVTTLVLGVLLIGWRALARSLTR